MLSPRNAAHSLRRRKGDRHAIAKGAVSGQTARLPYLEQMEAAFGADFSDVRAYLGDSAREANEQLGSNGFSVGDSVAFKDANPSVQTVAHELAHYRQKTGQLHLEAAEGPVRTSSVEDQADTVASIVAAGGKVPAGLLTSDSHGAIRLECDPKKASCEATDKETSAVPEADVPGLEAPEADAPRLDAPEADAPERTGTPPEVIGIKSETDAGVWAATVARYRGGGVADYDAQLMAGQELLQIKMEAPPVQSEEVEAATTGQPLHEWQQAYAVERAKGRTDEEARAEASQRTGLWHGLPITKVDTESSTQQLPGQDVPTDGAGVLAGIQDDERVAELMATGQYSEAEAYAKAAEERRLREKAAEKARAAAASTASDTSGTAGDCNPENAQCIDHPEAAAKADERAEAAAARGDLVGRIESGGGVSSGKSESVWVDSDGNEVSEKEAKKNPDKYTKKSAGTSKGASVSLSGKGIKGTGTIGASASVSIPITAGLSASGTVAGSVAVQLSKDFDPDASAKVTGKGAISGTAGLHAGIVGVASVYAHVKLGATGSGTWALSNRTLSFEKATAELAGEAEVGVDIAGELGKKMQKANAVGVQWTPLKYTSPSLKLLTASKIGDSEWSVAPGPDIAKITGWTAGAVEQAERHKKAMEAKVASYGREALGPKRSAVLQWERENGAKLPDASWKKIESHWSTWMELDGEQHLGGVSQRDIDRLTGRKNQELAMADAAIEAGKVKANTAEGKTAYYSNETIERERGKLVAWETKHGLRLRHPDWTTIESHWSEWKRLDQKIYMDSDLKQAQIDALVVRRDATMTEARATADSAQDRAYPANSVEPGTADHSDAGDR